MPSTQARFSASLKAESLGTSSDTERRRRTVCRHRTGGTKIGNHTFRATGITAYLKNGGKLEIAQQIATHESSLTTGLYDRCEDDVSLDEV